MSLISRQPSLQALLSAGNPPLRPLQDKPLIQRPHPQVVLKPAPPQVIPVSKAPVVLEPLKQKQPMDDKDNTAMAMMDLASDQMLQNVVQKVIEESATAKQLLLKQQKKKEDKMKSILVMKEVGEMIKKAFPSDKKGDPGSGLKEGLVRMMEDAVKSLQGSQQGSLPAGGSGGGDAPPSIFSVFSPGAQQRSQRAINKDEVEDFNTRAFEERRKEHEERKKNPEAEEAKESKPPTSLNVDMKTLTMDGADLRNIGYGSEQLKKFIIEINKDLPPRSKLNTSGSKPELRKRVVNWLIDNNYNQDDDTNTIPVEQGEGLFGGSDSSSDSSSDSKKHKKIPVGAHHVIDTTKFGKGILSISRVDKYGLKRKVVGFKNRPLSEAYKEALTHVLRTRKQPDLSDLTPEERENYFKVIALSSLPVDGMNTKHIQALQEAKKENSGHQGKANKETKLKAVKERLAMLVGQMNSGNDGNPEIIKEVKGILALLVKWELMTHKTVADFVKKYVR